MKIKNEMRLDFPAAGKNESFARLVISAFVLPLNPTLEELADVKTAVSEAVTNAIVHGYADAPGTVRLHAVLYEDDTLKVDVIDNGRGIEDIALARTPFFTTCAEDERSGMGFTVMESFMDEVSVQSKPGRGTTVTLVKRLRACETESARRA
ncbi:MAG: Anti-sigma F factor [Firmicutes bacterium ADurb.Bin467]|nr:MAG: Anti-sigma F factor [Firmicutes bacterium ADurb.Bin467]